MIICKVSTQSKKLFRREIVRWDDGSSSSYPQRQQIVITIKPVSTPLRPDVNRLYDMIVPSVKHGELSIEILYTFSLEENF